MGIERGLRKLMAKRKYKPSKGGRTEATNVRMTPRIKTIVKALKDAGYSIGDLVELIALQKAGELGIPIPAEVNHAE
jgi:hypothetical protein